MYCSGRSSRLAHAATAVFVSDHVRATSVAYVASSVARSTAAKISGASSSAYGEMTPFFTGCPL